MFCSQGIKIAHWPQWWTAFALGLSSLGNGLKRGWTSPYLAQLTAPDNVYSLKLTYSEASWVAALLNLGVFAGAIIGFFTQEPIGRKKTLVLGGIPVAISWLCIIVANSVTWLYTAQLFAGIGAGMMSVALPLFLCEIADPSIRGSLVFLNASAATVGNFIGNIMGPIMTMDKFSYVALVITALYLVLFSLVPESPYHHVVKDDLTRAERSLLWYKRNADAKHELQVLQDLVGETRVSFVSRLKVLKKSVHQRNLLIVCGVNVFVFFAGVALMPFYAEIILTASKTQITPSSVVSGLGFCAIIAGALSVVFVDKFGRRTLLMGASFGIIVANILLGTHFYMLEEGFDPTTIGWLPILALFIEYICIGCGLRSVPYILVGELFPPVLKTIASFIYTAVAALLAFLTTKMYQLFIDLVGESYVFWFFAASAAASVVFTYFFVPETRGKTLAKIQENFKKGENNEINMIRM